MAIPDRQSPRSDRTTRPNEAQPGFPKIRMTPWSWSAAGLAMALVIGLAVFATTENRRRHLSARAGADTANSPANPISASTPATEQPPPGPTPPGMVWIPGGEFSMGSDDRTMNDARPVHRVRVNGFWMDRTEVTNAQFARFVKETGYVTIAERKPDPKDFPGTPPSFWCRVRSSSHPRARRFPWTIISSGGATYQGQAGGILRVRTARSKDMTTTRSSRFAGLTRSNIASGPESDCRPKPSGSMPRVAVSSASDTSGAMRSIRTVSG